MGGLIDLKTNLRSFHNGGGYTLLDGSNYKPTKEVPVPDGFKGLKYGRDLPGGGSSNQPYVTSPISNGLGFNTPDFFLRQGALQSALVDTARLTSWFGDSVNGLLFTAKQIALERMNPKIPGGLNRIYNPLNTIAQVGVLPLNIHLNKQGINGANFGYAEGGREGYYYFTKEKAEENISRLSLLFDTKIASSKPLTTRTDEQRLFNISRDPEYSLSYDGGPGSIGGVGRTRIPMAGDGSNSSRDRTTTYRLNSGLIENPNEVYAFNNELLAKQESRGVTKNTSLTNLIDYRATINEALDQDVLPHTPSGFNREDTYGTAKTVYRVDVTKKDLLKNPNASVNSDAINKLRVLLNSDSQVTEYQNKDLVSFYFEVLNPKNNTKDKETSNFLFFRAYITDLGDSYKAEWQNYKYVGRAENFYKYGGFGRDVSLSFTIYAHSREEMIPLYAKLNNLVGVTAPTYSNQGFMMGNILKITVGNYFNQMPGILTSISLKPSFEAGWDINRNQDGTILKLGDQDYVGQLPRLIDVSMNFTPIHNSAPQYGNNFINYHSSQEILNSVSITGQESTDPAGPIPPIE